MSRLLTLLLLYQNGYEVGKYISVEKKIEETKDVYYGVLECIDAGWHEEQGDCRLSQRKPFLGALKRLTDDEVVVKCGTGRGTFYVRKDAIE